MSSGVNKRTNRPHKVNARSLVLRDDEHQVLFSLIGPNGVAQATAVVRVYRSLPDSPNQWTKVGVGVATFVKDSKMRSFYIRIYNLCTKTKFFEEEMYNEFDYRATYWHFHHFTGAAGVCGLSFHNREEADLFKAVIDNRMEARAQKRREKRMKENNKNTLQIEQYNNNSSSSNNGPSFNMNGGSQQSIVTNGDRKTSVQSMHIVEVGGKTENGMMTSKNKLLGASSNSISKQSNSLTSRFSLSGKKSKNNTKKKEISKDDIGGPTNFQHLEHVGAGPMRKSLYPSPGTIEILGQMLVSNGVCSKEELQTENIRLVINQFISSNASLDDVIKAFHQNLNNGNITSSNTTSQPVESLPRRHSVHSPPASVDKKDHYFGQNFQNGSASTVKPMAPVRRPPPDPARKDSAAEVAQSHRTTQQPLRPNYFENDAPQRPPLPPTPVVNKLAYLTDNNDPTPVSMSYDGRAPFTPSSGAGDRNTTKKAPPPPPPSHPSKLSATPVAPPKSPRRSSMERFTANQNSTLIEHNSSSDNASSALFRPGSRVAISGPISEPPASIIKTTSSFVSGPNRNNSAVSSLNTNASDRYTTANLNTSEMGNSMPRESEKRTSDRTSHEFASFSQENNHLKYSYKESDERSDKTSPRCAPPPPSKETRPVVSAPSVKKKISPPTSGRVKLSDAAAPQAPVMPAPPPPPPPPPPVISPPSINASAKSVAPSPANEHSKVVPEERAKPDDLLNAIKNASVAALKPASERKIEPAKEAPVNPKDDLLGEIRQFKKDQALKKVEPIVQNKEDSSEKNTFDHLPSLFGDLARLVNAQRMAMNPDSAENSATGADDSSDNDSFDDEDWD